MRLEGIRIDAVIENGVDTYFFSQNSSLKENNFFTIGTVIKFSYALKVQGLKVLLNAFSEVTRSRSDVRLKIVGDGPLVNYVKEMIAGLDSETRKKIFLLGQLDYNIMPAFYDSLDVFAHISFQDAAPNTLLEAMSCGLPVMASDIGNCSQVLDDNAGWIVRPAIEDIKEKLGAILTLDKRTLERKGEAARNKVKKGFSWKKTALSYLTLYDR